MALFQFTAVRQGGEKFSGEREARDKHELVESLREEGATALSVAPARSHASGKKSLLSMEISFLSGIPNMEKILFARNLSAMSAAGLPLSRALGVLEKQTKNKSMKRTIREIGEDIKQGHALSEALSRRSKVFTPLFSAMVRAGEESGTLAPSLQVVATQMEKAHALTKKIRGAMIYPAIVITVMIAIFILMLIYVVPTLSATFASLNAELPLPTQIVLGISNALVTHTFPILIGIAVVVGGLVAAIRSRVGKLVLDRGILFLPVIGPIVAKVNAARTARTLSSLLAAGVSALVALDITRDIVQNARFRPVIKEARELVEKGKPLSDAFVEAETIYPVMFAEMAAVGEETGDLAGMLAKVADFYENEVEQQTKDLSTIIEPLLMVVIGAGVGFFAIAMIMPIYSLSSNI